MRTSRFTCLLALSFLLASCRGEKPQSPPLRVDAIVASAEPIQEGKLLPRFANDFPVGTKTVYVYTQFENVATMTGSFPVQMTWFSPNDFLPPRRRTSVDLTPPQNIAAFEIHEDAGMEASPHMIQIHAGKNLTASGTLRFYIGMTQKDIDDLLLVEKEYKQHLEEERRKAEEPTSLSGAELGGPEEEKKRAASGATMTGASM